MASQQKLLVVEVMKDLKVKNMVAFTMNPDYRYYNGRIRIV
jgi:hypothetical protein